MQFDPGLEYCKTNLIANPVNNLTQQQQQSLQTQTTKVNSIQTQQISPPQKTHLSASNTFSQTPSCQIMCNMNTDGPYSFI